MHRGRGEMQEERPRSNDQIIDCGGHDKLWPVCPPGACHLWSLPAGQRACVGRFKLHMTCAFRDTVSP